MDATLDIDAVRARFPALGQTQGDRPVVFLDNPGGTQVPGTVIAAMSGYLVRHNANHGGVFPTSQRSDAILADAHAAMADMLGATSPDEIVFGANMTTLTFALSRALARELRPGDEVVVTRMDHDANIAPWLLAARDTGADVRWVDFDVEDYTLDMAGLRGVLNERTRLVAVGYASNALGTVNDVAAIVRWAHEAGALAFVDAVQYAPHGPIDVGALGCDFLVCSAYKFYGPHVGVLYGRRELLERLEAYKVRPAPDGPPDKFETGTLNHEGIAGTLAAVAYLAELGERYGGRFTAGFSGLSGRRLQVKAGLAALRDYDDVLSAAILSELEQVPGIRIHGVSDRHRLGERVPTVSFTWPGHHPQEVARALGERGIYVWDGNYYALEVTRRLGVEAQGGMVRIGAVHYNTVAEIERLGEALRAMA